MYILVRFLLMKVFLTWGNCDTGSSTKDPLLIDSIDVSASEVYDLLRDLDPHKACGPDLLPTRLLKEAGC